MLIQGGWWSQAREGGDQRAEASSPAPSPGCLCSLHVASVSPQLSVVPPPASRSQLSPTSAFVSTLQGRPAGVSLNLFLPLPSPLRPATLPAPAPGRPASKPGEATSVLNPKSCQLNCSLRLRRLLLTSGEPGEAKPPPTRWGGGRRRPPPGLRGRLSIRPLPGEPRQAQAPCVRNSLPPDLALGDPHPLQDPHPDPLHRPSVLRSPIHSKTPT